MFSFFRKKAPPPAAPPEALPAPAPAAAADTAPAAAAVPAPAPAPERSGWLGRLAQGLRKTGSSLAQVFTGTKIDDALYEELESALLMADAGVAASEVLLADLKRRVKEHKATDPAAVKALLADAITDLLSPLERWLRAQVGRPWDAVYSELVRTAGGWRLRHRLIVMG